MTVKDFKEFCRVRDIVLKDSYNGRVYSKIDNYLDKQVTGFYPRFDLMRSNDTHNPMCRIQIVAWIEHDFERSNNNDRE